MLYIKYINERDRGTDWTSYTSVCACIVNLGTIYGLNTIYIYSTQNKGIVLENDKDND